MSTMTRDEVLKLLRESRDQDATEIHFKVPNRPLFRIGGELLPQGPVLLTPASTQQAAQVLCGLANLDIPPNSTADREFSFGVNGIGRFQVNIFRQRGSTAVVVQRSELTIPSPADLGFGPEVEALLRGQGLTLIVGGRRRAGLLASLVDRYNATTRGFAIVLEDPITYLHRDAMASIAQRGVGADVTSIAAGVAAAGRQNPDLLACGDVRDRATVEGLIDLAERGTMTFAAVPAPRAEDAVGWITRLYTRDERPDVEERVNRCLRAVLFMPDHGPGVWVQRR
jgi:twitching motility protein PilT